MIDSTVCKRARVWTALYVYVCRNAYIRRSLFAQERTAGALLSLDLRAHSLTEALQNERCRCNLIEGKMTRCGDEDAEESPWAVDLK
jgi:hypothetical protein